MLAKKKKPTKKKLSLSRLQQAIAGLLLLVVLTGGFLLSRIDFRTDVAKGLIYAGLSPGQKGGPCEGMYEIEKLPDLCTHGPDAAPKGIDVRMPADPLAVQAGIVHAAASTVKCFSNGQDGARVQGIYAYLEGNPDNYDLYVNAIVGYAAQMEQIFIDSAAQTGGEAHIRYVHDSACRPIIAKVKLPRSAEKDMYETVYGLTVAGHNRTDRKYVVWTDANSICGVGTTTNDDSPKPNNRSNVQTGYARVDRACWGANDSHQLVHMIGGVQDSAPNSDRDNHCRDIYESLCFTNTPDGLTGPNRVPISYQCPYTQVKLLDCNDDDYFSTSPDPNSYIGTHWNTARSVFLSTSVPKLPVAVLTPPPPKPRDFEVTAVAASKDGNGLWILKGDGRISICGNTGFDPGYFVSRFPGSQFVDLVPTPSGKGMWAVDDRGEVKAAGDAKLFGGTGNIALVKPIVGMAATKSGNGYWLAGGDGGVFAFGDAQFKGSTGAIKLNVPIVGLESKPPVNPANQGYWLAAGDGGVFSFGSAPFRGSFGNAILRARIVGMKTTPTGNGYWFVAADGGVFGFGEAQFYGSLGNEPLGKRITAAMAPTPSGKGYWLVDRQGTIFPFGDAKPCNYPPY